MRSLFYFGSLTAVFMLSLVAALNFRKGFWNPKSSIFRRFQSVATQQPISKVFAPSHPSYDKLEDFTLKEFGLTGSIYSHKKTGAQVRRW
jgi:hypothetical protein